MSAIRVRGQDAIPTNALNGFISQAGDVASVLGAANSATKTGSSTTSSAASSTSASSATASSTYSPSPAAATSAAAAASSGGLDDRTRTIIIAVCVVVGLLLVGALIGCIFCCLVRRRRRRRRTATPDLAARGRDWHHHDTSHHGFDPSRSSHSDSRYPSMAQVPHHEATPMMAGAHRNHANHTPRVEDHPAYRGDLERGPPNVNADNPFTPTPPVSRKPVPTTGSGHHPVMAAGAGAAAGAAAMHHHDKHEQGQTSRTPDYEDPHLYAQQALDQHQAIYNQRHSPRGSSPYASHSSTPNLAPIKEQNSQRRRPVSTDSTRFEPSPQGPIEPSVAYHNLEYPNAHTADHSAEAQRNSLQERERRASWGEHNMADGYLNRTSYEKSPRRTSYERSPKRTSFSDGGALGAGILRKGGVGRDRDSRSPRGIDPARNSDNSYHPHVYAGNPNPRALRNSGQGYHDSAYISNTDTSSSDSWRSAPMAPPDPPFEPGRRYSGTYDQLGRTHSNSPRRSIGADGKPRRLRFSDVQPEEYRYDDSHPVGQAM